MRIEPFLNYLKGYDFSRAASLATTSRIVGGWEAWFQVELADRVISALEAEGMAAMVVRETFYPDMRRRCDLCFGRPAPGGFHDTTYVELKCQLPGTVDPIADALRRFQIDINKQRVSYPDESGFCLLACCGPLTDAHISTLAEIHGQSLSAFVLIADPSGVAVKPLEKALVDFSLKSISFFLIGVSPRVF
jgi:hypothetical protein